MSVVGIIPARLDSSRLPGKLLLSETGRPMLQHTWEAACRSRRLDQVVVASDSAEIRDACRVFGAECEMTGEHPSGSDRIAEVVGRRFAEAAIVVNVQGDEPELDSSHIDRLVDTLENAPEADMATLATPIRDVATLQDNSCTKVVVAETGAALYFSRSPIPHARDDSPEQLVQGDSPYLLHIGIYAYRVPFLLRMTSRPPSRLERLEKLEQLRALEMGGRIQVALVDHPSVGIDTPDDYLRFVARYRAAKHEA